MKIAVVLGFTFWIVVIAIFLTRCVEAAVMVAGHVAAGGGS